MTDDDRTRALTDPRLTAVGLLFEVTQAIESRLAPQLSEHGLSSVEAGVAIRLARSPDTRLRMSDLAAQADLSASGLTRVVDRLERLGLVRRDACVTDRRVTYAVLTQTGLNRVLDVLPGHLAAIDELFTGLLDDDELAGLLGGLRTVRDAIRPTATAGADGHRAHTTA
jgi:MarR family transcriptional regulator, 2-MHQ and catechol-resistance regulon repressor